MHSYKPLVLGYVNSNPDLKVILKVAKIGTDVGNSLLTMINGIKNAEAHAHVSNEGNIREHNSVQNNNRNGYDVLYLHFF